MDGPVQAVVTAPLFVFIEVIGRVRSSWSPCGDGDRQVFDLMRVRLLRVFAGAA